MPGENPRYRRILRGLSIALLVTAGACSPRFVVMAPPPVKDPARAGTITVVRPPVASLGTAAMGVVLDGRTVGVLDAESALSIPVAAGDHDVGIRGWGIAAAPSMRKVRINPGQSKNFLVRPRVLGSGLSDFEDALENNGASVFQRRWVEYASRHRALFPIGDASVEGWRALFGSGSPGKIRTETSGEAARLVGRLPIRLFRLDGVAGSHDLFGLAVPRFNHPFTGRFELRISPGAHRLVVDYRRLALNGPMDFSRAPPVSGQVVARVGGGRLYAVAQPANAPRYRGLPPIPGLLQEQAAPVIVDWPTVVFQGDGPRVVRFEASPGKTYRLDARIEGATASKRRIVYRVVEIH